MTALIIVCWVKAASAQTVTEFPLPSAASTPQGIALGQDRALWFTEYVAGQPPSASKIGRITTGGVISEFPLPSSASAPQGIVAGPDGAMWFVETNPAAIGRIATDGAITEFAITPPTGTTPAVGAITVGSDGALWFPAGSMGPPIVASVIGRITTDGTITFFTIPGGGTPAGIAAGPDGALWITAASTVEFHAALVDRLTTAGASSTYSVLMPLNNPTGIAAGPDGALWFTGGFLGRITTSGSVTNFFSSATAGGPNGIASGPDGALWFVQVEENNNSSTGVIGRITTGDTNTQFPTLTSGNLIQSIVAGPDGAMWFTEQGVGKIGRIGPLISTSPLVSAVLPSSRSVQVGVTATAFATVINAGTSVATSCAIAPVSGLPVSFSYQTTDPTSNAATGSANTPVTIAAGGSQSFVIALTTNAPFTPVDTVLGFDCAGTDAAASISGLNTLLFSASATPVPDIITLSATASGDGILDISGTAGSGAFALATANVGAAGSIIATADTGAAALPVKLTLCQTNPMTGQCLAPPSASVPITIDTDDTPTFSIFATASGAIPFAPGGNRIFVRFKDSGGVVRGSTSVAVRTQ